MSTRTDPGARTRFSLLGRGHVTIWRVEDGEVDADVTDCGVWRVKRRNWAWSCSCPLDDCVHVEAVRKVAPRLGMVRHKRGLFGWRK